MSLGRYQIVLHLSDAWPWRLEALGPYPERGPALGGIFRWRILIGPLEIRKWSVAGTYIKKGAETVDLRP